MSERGRDNPILVTFGIIFLVGLAAVGLLRMIDHNKKWDLDLDLKIVDAKKPPIEAPYQPPPAKADKPKARVISRPVPQPPLSRKFLDAPRGWQETCKRRNKTTGSREECMRRIHDRHGLEYRDRPQYYPRSRYPYP